MKNACIGIALLGALLIASCKKDKHLVTPDLAGVYVGKSDANSNRLEEVFTSPTESHWEWTSDSIARDPDTLQVVAISADSFELKGNILQWIPANWRRFAFSDGAGETPLVFDRSETISGYYSNTLSLSIDTETHHLVFDYHREQTTPLGNTQVNFEGAR